MQWLYSAFNWYIYIFVLGILFIPLTRLLFPDFIDRGYAFSKTIAILLVSYAMFVLATVRILPFSRLSLFALITVFGALNIYIVKRIRKRDVQKVVPKAHLYRAKIGGVWPASSTRKGSKKILPDRSSWKAALPLIIFEELLFLAAFIFLVYVRGQEPSIQSLEKFMDFGFINSILRSTHFPPLDMWYAQDPTHPAGYPINYYYFGHLTGGVLIKLTGLLPATGYNLILATIFAQSMSMVFSLVVNIISFYQTQLKKRVNLVSISIYGLIGTILVNLGGNLHTIYLFTKGYPNDSPIPFWKILSGYNPTSYWYPNATRFIPYTIHEFPSYSYVVADLHGHVFNIPFVLLMLAFLFVFFIKMKQIPKEKIRDSRFEIRNKKSFLSSLKILSTNYFLLYSAFFGFLIAIHYMTNAFDGPIYLLLLMIFALLVFRFTKKYFLFIGFTILTFLIFSLPLTLNFSPFVSGIGVNCASALSEVGRLGPFLFEKDKCQVSPLWMLGVLWGFFVISFIFFLITQALRKLRNTSHELSSMYTIDTFFLVVFSFGIFLLIIPEFFYVKDIYPTHFRANTMFKLGYQAFIMMSIAAAFTFYRINTLTSHLKVLLKFVFIGLFFLLFLYPFFSFTAYYGPLNKKPQLDGSLWLQTEHPEDKEIIEYLNHKVKNQPVILEAQGDSYTQYERISAYTGLPTVAGWWVHEWLWRGSADVVGRRIPDVEALYQSKDINETKKLLAKYNISYVVISSLEREKYKNLYTAKFDKIGRRVFVSSNRFGALYQVK